MSRAKPTIDQIQNLESELNSKQDNLISGTNIKTINGNSILGSGDLVIDTGAQVEDQILNGVVDKAPSQNAVYDALQLSSTPGLLQIRFATEVANSAITIQPN